MALPVTTKRLRLTMTNDPMKRIPAPSPQGYQANQYLDLLPLLNKGRMKRALGNPYQGLHGGHLQASDPIS